MISMHDIIQVGLIGIGATMVMDIWLFGLKRIGVQTANFAFIGRWVGHLLQGRIAHASIAKARPIGGELCLGWLTHYAVGIGFAALLAAQQGLDWVRQPSVVPALALGVATVAAPLFVMQPAMGAGFAGARTPAPLKNILRSVANHAVFGAGLYLAATLLAWAAR